LSERVFAGTGKEFSTKFGIDKLHNALLGKFNDFFVVINYKSHFQWTRLWFWK